MASTWNMLDGVVKAESALFDVEKPWILDAVHVPIPQYLYQGLVVCSNGQVCAA